MSGPAVSTLLLAESLVRCGYTLTLFVTLRPSPSISAELEALGVSVVCPYVNKGWNYGLPPMQIAWRLKRHATRTKPLCIISMGLTSEALHALRLSVAQVHLWENTEALPGIKFVDDRFAGKLDRAAGLIAPSRTIEKNMRSTYNWDGPVRRLPFWCANPQRRSKPARSTVRNFLYWGRLDPDKGLLQLVDAFKRIAKQHPDARLTIAGAGSFPALQEAVERTSNIVLRGYVSKSEYEAVLALADVCVLPSLHEGYPLVLLEACAHSKPVIATRVGSIPELFEGRRAALLVPAGDVRALADAIVTMLEEDISAYRERCADARQLYEELADLDVIDRKVRTLIGEIGQSEDAL